MEIYLTMAYFKTWGKSKEKKVLKIFKYLPII